MPNLLWSAVNYIKKNYFSSIPIGKNLCFLINTLQVPNKVFLVPKKFCIFLFDKLSKKNDKMPTAYLADNCASALFL